jgi:4-hydroxy-4-methyl-2-oxoglutarate aldolase
VTTRWVQQLLKLSTTILSDSLDTLGVDGGCAGIRPLRPGLKCAGPAYTVRFEPVTPGEPAPAAAYIDDVPEGSIIVLDNDGRTTCTVWGDILTVCAQRRGVAGTVIHGACRDSGGIRELNYPLYSLTSYMKSGKNRVRMVARNVPVTVGKTVIHPGDLLLGDDDGVLAIPAALAERAIDTALRVEEMEGQVLREVKAGMSLQAARQAHGYDRYAFRERGS